MRKFFEISLGIITSIGGFLEAGAIATTAQAGAAFGFQLIWALLLGTVCVVCLVEMSGRLAAVSKHTLKDAMRERFGVGFHLVTLIPGLLVDWLVLAAEIGGVSLALQFLTGVPFQVWAIPVALLIWLVLWKGSFGFIESGVSVLGLVALAFAVGAVKMAPSWNAVAAGMLPTWPLHDGASYWFIAVSILGAAISPYLFYFYSSGAIEDRWDEDDVPSNRVVATIGMTFGGVLALGVLILAAVILHPAGIRVESYEQMVALLTVPFGPLGFYLFVAILAVTCFSAALEVSLGVAYVVAQGFGWTWGLNTKPERAARFTLVYTGMIAASVVLVVVGIDPLKLTVFSMAVTAATLPLVTIPFIILMNDSAYVGSYRNGWLGNTAVIGISLLASLLALVAIPLQIMGG